MLGTASPAPIRPLFSGATSAYARTNRAARNGPGLVLAQSRAGARYSCQVSARGSIVTMKRLLHNSTRSAWAAFLILPLITAWANAAHAASPFPDKNLEAAIRGVLKHEPNVELTDEKLQNVYILEAPGKDIKDLTGLEKCKNLALIKLSKNKISELKPLKDLTNLQSLDLADNAIKDIGPLAALKGLQYIELSNNQIEKLEPLSGLTSLTALYMGGNAIKDIAPLAPLVKLWSLSVPRNQIKDIKPLEKVNKLSTIDLNDNQVEDVSPLTKQTEVKLLLIERNQIKDLKALVDAAKADSAGPKRFAPYLHVYLSGNPLSDVAKSSQIAALKAAEVRIEEKSGTTAKSS
jgi:internalin A